MTDLQSAIHATIRAAGRILIVSHVRPDGDAIGSTLALGLALLDAGKQVQMVLAGGVPDSFRHLPGSDQVRSTAKGEFDCIISVDCSAANRIGTILEQYRAPDIVIDHHVTAEAFGTLNLVEPEAVATASVLVRHMRSWGLTISAPIAANLITGIVTDTLGFRTDNVTPEVLRQVADLMELGVDMSRLYYLGLIRRSLPDAKYWGAGLASLEFSDGIIWTTLSVSDRNAAGYKGEDDADLINFLSAIDEADIAIIFVEQNPDKTKVSWRRLKPRIDVSRIARQFNGGGHKAASGAEIDGSLALVRDRVLAATREALQNFHKNGKV